MNLFFFLNNWITIIIIYFYFLQVSPENDNDSDDSEDEEGNLLGTGATDTAASYDTKYTKSFRYYYNIIEHKNIQFYNPKTTSIIFELFLNLMNFTEYIKKLK